MKIGIISAVPEEINTIHDDINFYDTINYAAREFYLGKYENIELVLVYSKVGKVAASITASALIEKFKVDKIIFTGLAGAVSKQLERGDIVLADATYQHDFDARPFCSNQFEIPLTGQGLFKLSSDEADLAKRAINNFLSNLEQYVDLNELERLQVKKPKSYVGIIATGDKFISNASCQKNMIIEGIEAMAVEMEGAAIAQVCAEYKMPYILIRTISDKADCSAVHSLQDFSVQLASHYASGIVEEILKLLA